MTEPIDPAAVVAAFVDQVTRMIRLPASRRSRLSAFARHGESEWPRKAERELCGRAWWYTISGSRPDESSGDSA